MKVLLSGFTKYFSIVADINHIKLINNKCEIQSILATQPFLYLKRVKLESMARD